MAYRDQFRELTERSLLLGEPITATVIGATALLLNVTVDVLVEITLEKIGGVTMKALKFLQNKLRVVPLLKKLTLSATTSVIATI